MKAKAGLVAKGFKQKTAYEIMPSLVGSEMCIRDRQGASVLFAKLGPLAGTEMVEALISNQRTSDEGELPKELVQDVEFEPASFQDDCSSKHALIWDKAMSAEFEGLLGAGTFALAAKTPEGCNVIDARWVYKWKADETGKIVKAKARLAAKRVHAEAWRGLS